MIREKRIVYKCEYCGKESSLAEIITDCEERHEENQEQKRMKDKRTGRYIRVEK